MSLADELRDIARHIAQNALGAQSNLEQEIFDLEKAISEKKAEMDIARNASKRVASFAVKIGADYACPTCWMHHERRSVIHPIGGGTRRQDNFRCDTCGQTVTLGA